MQNIYSKNKKEKNNFFFKKKKILITGATGNVGKNLAESFAKLNCDLILTDLDQTKLIKLSNFLLKYRVQIDVKSCNLVSNKSLNSFYKWLNKFKVIDTLINNAAYVGTSRIKNWNKEFYKQTSENWDEVFRLNLSSVFSLSQKLSNKLSKSNFPSIINISSVYSIIHPKLEIYKNSKINNPAGYSTSKAGLTYLTKWLAVNLASKRIRVNSISPGGIDTGQDKRFKKNYISKTLLGRMAKREDIFNSCLFLSSEMSNHITGQNIVVDGGFSIK